MTTSAIPSADRMSEGPASPRHAPETDSIPRVRIRDLMVGLQFLGRNPEATLEALRVKLNTDRKAPGGRTAGYSVARDVASELDRLGYANAGPLPKDAKGFEKKRDSPVRLTEAGRDLAQLLRRDRGEAYVALLKASFSAHPYMRRFVAAVARGPVLAPVVTSAKQHLSDRYGTAKALADHVAQGSFDTAALLEALARRIGRPLAQEEAEEITQGVDALVARLATSAAGEPQTEFARKMLMAINEVVVPAVLRREGLCFDYNSLRRLWLMGEEFQISWATSAHPLHDGWLTIGTATIDLDAAGERIEALRFDNSLARMREGFLERLYDAYERLQGWNRGTIVNAWELRAAFCVEHRCAPGVFDHLFAENSGGSDAYTIYKDFPRNKPAHERPLVVGGRQIGLVRIARR